MKKLPLGRRRQAESSSVLTATPLNPAQQVGTSPPELDLSNATNARTSPYYGLMTLFEPSDPANAVVDIVFVHGLRGDSHSTWSHNKSQVQWPTKLLRGDIPDARILAFGYDADIVNFWSPASQNRVGNHAEKLLGDLVRRRERSDSVGNSTTWDSTKQSRLLTQVGTPQDNLRSS